MDKILITGADGFIGSHLTEKAVRSGLSVRALVQYNCRNHWGWLEDLPQQFLNSVEVISGDLRDPFCMEKAMSGCQKVFHLGALIAIPYSYVAPHEYIATNVAGTLNVLEAARKAGVERFIHTSTSEVYGTAQYVPIDEKHPLQGQSPYSASKIAADKLAESFHLSFGLPVVTVRPFNTYGPRQSARAVIPTIVSQAFDNPEIRLGSLTPVRDLTFVEDTVNGFLLAAKASGGVGEVINLGVGSGVTVGDLANQILALMKMQKPIVQADERMRPEKSEVMRLVSDNSKARSLIGWAPQVTLEKGLSQTIDWISQHRSIYKSGLYNV
ncbi:MAG: GDP-mannose 4,6-dehydratase [Deltaproteobacteria bacterium]|nr:GDP-mannose 4,6-dehydratase [Deltaproteobacteria bacterium]MBI3294156.1 GDP-mannose 4,6-dehydratase [Deltaproteobacteria bacterium]